MTTEVSDLLAQAKALKDQAEAAVKERRGAVAKAETEVSRRREDLKTAARAALTLGVDRKVIAQWAGVSESTVGGWLHEPNGKPDPSQSADGDG